MAITVLLYSVMNKLTHLEKTDTHLHSTYSDGSNTPEQLVKRSVELGMNTIALTDHDTISGIDEFLAAGKKYGIQTIAGIEFSVENFDGISDIDHLGYFEHGISHKNEIEHVCSLIKAARKRRVEKMVTVFNKLGFQLTIEHIMAFDKGDGLVGRSQVARAVYAENSHRLSGIQEVFDKYLGDGLAADVKIDYALSLKDAIDLIHHCGGISVAAHPGVSNGKTKDKELGKKMLIRCFELGADGAEGIYIYHKNRPYLNSSFETSVALCAYYTNIILDHNKQVFAGSDHHGTNKEIEIGEQLAIIPHIS